MLLTCCLCSVGCTPESVDTGVDTEIEGGDKKPGDETPGTGDTDGGGENVNPNIPEGFEDEKDDTAADPNLTFDYSVVRKAGHPRLLCDAQGFADLKIKVTSGRFQYKTLYKLHSEVIARADKIVAADRSFTSADDHYIILDNLLCCAYAYKIKGQSAYLVKVQKDMEKVASLPNWNPSGLSIGEISLGMALAYDWLYYDLPLDLRVKARKAMGTMGVRPNYNKSFEKTIGNWNSICLGGCVCASLAIYEKDKQMAAKQIEKAIKENTIGVTGMYKPDGNYGEGIGYWEYGGSFQSCFMSALKGIFGSTGGIMEIPGFMQSGEYAAFMLGTMNTSFSYSDGGGTTEPALLTSWWFAAQNDDPTLIYRQKLRLDDQNDAAYKNTSIDGSEQPYRLLAAMVVMLRDFDMERTITPPTKEVWSGNGEMPVVMVRKGWKFDETDVYLGIKAGQADSWEMSSTSHAHMDAGSFVFEAEGVRWSDDIMRPSYGKWFAALTASGSRSGDTSQSGLRWDTFRVNNLCHSTIVSFTNDGSVKGKLHDNDYYVDGFATIDKVINEGGRQGGVVNMTPPMKGQVKSAKRTVELVNGTDLVVTDEITALPNLDCKLEWRMLSVSNATVGTDKVSLTKDGKTRNLTVTSSDASLKPEYKTWKAARPGTDYWRPAAEIGWKDMSWDTGISERIIAGWSATVPAGKTVTFTTILKK